MPEYIELIKNHVSDWQKSDGEICEALNVPSVDNPVAPVSVPRRLVKMEVLQTINQAHCAAVLNYVNLNLVYQSFDAQDHGSAVSWVQALYMIGAIDQTDAGAAIAYITATVPDPDWPARISWAQANIGRPATCEDINMAREANNAGN